MTSRVVAFADTHLQGTNPRNVDRLQTFDQIVSEGSALPDLAAFVHAGDVFHGRSTPDDRVAVAERFTAMADRAPLVVVYGNHCAPLDLHVFGRLKARFPIHIVDTPKVWSLTLATGERATFAALPFPTKGELVAMGHAPADIQNVGVELLDPIFMTLGAELASARERGEPTLFIGHVTIAGAITGAGQPMGQFGEIVVTGAHLQRLAPTPAIFGHIHEPQTIHDAWYCGSTSRLDFGEVSGRRYLTIAYPGGVIESHPIDCPARYHVEGRLTREAFTWQATKGPSGPVEQAPASWAGTEVRVRVEFKQSEKDVLDWALVRAPFAEALRLDVERVPEMDRALRAPQVVAAKTLQEKVQAWATVSGKPAPDSLLAKLARLERADPLVLLSEVQTELTRVEAGGNREAVSARYRADACNTLHGGEQ